MIEIYVYCRRTNELDAPDEVPRWAKRPSVSEVCNERLNSYRLDPERKILFLIDFLRCSMLPGVWAVAMIDRTAFSCGHLALVGYADRHEMIDPEEALDVYNQSQLEAVAGGKLEVPIDGIPYVGVVQCKRVLPKLA